jgi:hypothetical protein
VTVFKSALVKGVLAAAICGGSLVAATAASANVVCNQWRECWHVRDRFDYPSGVGIVVRGDDWGRAHQRDWHWRADRFDRGYYRNGVWIAF